MTRAATTRPVSSPTCCSRRSGPRCAGGTPTSSRPRPAGGTLVTDVVDTPIPARALRPMFGYRHRQLAADLAVHARAREVCPEPLTVAITGSSGVIGSALAALLTTGGHRVIRLVRRAPRNDGERQWRPDDPDPVCWPASTR